MKTKSMKQKIRSIVIFWCILNIGLFALSFVNVRGAGEEVQFVPWAYLFGAFIWEDLLVFSVFNSLASVNISTEVL